jgi:DNA-binding transcriptional LysR family regulator
VEVQHLRHLLAAVNHGNMGRAAEATNISQSGLSRSIQSLESRFGVPMFTRSTKGLEPTVYGLCVARRAEIILNEVARTKREIKSLCSAQVGEVLLGVTQNYAHYLVPSVLAKLHAIAPAVTVVIYTGGFFELVNRLKSGEIDLAFGLFAAMEKTDDITLIPLKEHHSKVVANCGHPLARRPVTSKDLSEARWVTLASDGFQRPFAAFFQSRSLPLPKQVFQSDSLDIIKQTARAIDALTVLPLEVVQDELTRGEAVVLDCEAPAEVTHVGLMHRTEGYISPQMRLLMTELENATLNFAFAD